MRYVHFMNAKLLNEIKDQFIAFANKNGINLAEHFDTPERFKDFIIGIVFQTLTEEIGLETPEAFNAIFGEGAYEKLAEDLFNEFNS